MAGPVDFNDDLHGIIHMEEHERNLVESPWFQRLRRIHQLGLASMVFPGAEHTRFAHSLGVFHLASVLGERLRNGCHITTTDLKELRAAALLHDIGHFPFSHTLESVYEAEEKQIKVAQAGPAPLESETASAPDESEDARQPAFHESFGRQVIERTTEEGGIARILAENDIEPARVGRLMVGQHENLLLNQVLHSDLDVDQLDYLLRDARATGSSYGQYDVAYLLESLGVARMEGNPVLCVHIRALHTLEHYVLARYFYYVCILYQKTRCIIEALLQEIARRLIGLGQLPSWNEVTAQVHERRFCWFDDVTVIESLRRVVRQNLVDSELHGAIMALLERDRGKLPRVEREEHKTDADPGDPVSIKVTGEGNAVMRAALSRMSTPKFTVLKRRLQGADGSDHGKALEVLTSDPEPIRVFQAEPYSVPDDTPGIAATDSQGGHGKVVLLESLSNSLVGFGKLAGQKTIIVRDYCL